MDFGHKLLILGVHIRSSGPLVRAPPSGRNLGAKMTLIGTFRWQKHDP